MSVSGMR